MKLMLMWPRGGPALQGLCDALEREGHEIVYVVSIDSEPYIPKGAIYHDHYDAWDGKRAPALANEVIAPATPDNLASRYELESLVLTMMNKRFDAASVEERKHLYHDALAYWLYVFQRLEPDGIIFEIIPHSIYNYIAFELARERGLFTYMFEEAVVGDRLVPYHDFWEGNRELPRLLQQFKREEATLGELDERIQHYWRSRREAAPAKPWYLLDMQRTTSGVGLWKIRARALVRSLRNGSFFKLAAAFVARKIKYGLPDEYNKFVRPMEFSNPYVYFPLQFQPERTTSPQGGVYHDQLLALEVLTAAIPDNWVIIVKEHPSQWAIRNKERYNSVRWRGYYKHLSRIPKVRVVPVATNSFALIDRSKAVAVITGTAGWEALMRGKQSLVFGKVWYRDCPGIHTVRTIEDCKRALSAVQKTVDDRDILAYLKAYESVSVRAHIGQPSDAVPFISEEEGTRVMTENIVRALKKYASR